MSKLHARSRFEIWKPIGQGRTLSGPAGKKVRIGRGQGSREVCWLFYNAEIMLNEV
jgi:hypothetical protein